MIKVLKIGDKEFKLEFTALSMIKVEKELGEGFFSQFQSSGAETIAERKKNFKASMIFNLFYGCLQKHHRVADVESAANIADAWFSEGHNLMELTEIVFEVFNGSNVLNAKERDSLKPDVPEFVTEAKVVDAK